MRKNLSFFTLLFLVPLLTLAQKENNIWVLANGNGVSFSGSAAAPINMPIVNDFFYGDARNSVCNADGELLFISDGKKVWDKNLNLMPNGIITSPSLVLGGSIIVPIPNDSNRYYVFSMIASTDIWGNYMSTNSALYYSVVDMRLNNGLGDVDPAFKWILLEEYMAGKIVAVRGESCNIWLIVKPKREQEYKAYEITRGGIAPNPVISKVGNLPLENYIFGPIKASQNGKKLAASLHTYSTSTTQGAIELYDFDPLTGRVSNAQLIDTGISDFFHGHILGQHYSDLCFSPDNSRLYASSTLAALPAPPQYVFQFDVTAATASAIMQSKSVIFMSQSANYYDFGYYRFGSLEMGDDGKMYCAKSYTWSPYASPCPLAVINFPNQLGLLSDPQLHSFDFLNTTQGHGHEAALPRRNLQRPYFNVAKTSEAFDTTVCYDSIIPILHLTADTSGNHMNFVWDNGDSTPTRAINESGIYVVKYQFDACTDKIDTFVVNFERTPTLVWDSLVCQNGGTAQAYAIPYNNTRIKYIWRKANSIIAEHESPYGDTITELFPGSYSLQMISSSGCDVTIDFIIGVFPQQDLIIDPENATIKYGDSIQLNVQGGGVTYAWTPVNNMLYENTSSPIVFPQKPTRYQVITTDTNGCHDTGYAYINIDYTMPDLIPNAFSPNGDGLNDVFKVEGLIYQNLTEFKVFNRYGQVVHEGGASNKGWDGTYKGAPCDAGTYFYIIQLSYPDGRTKLYKGDVVLIR